MYSKVLFASGNICQKNFIEIETGISSGIPQIQILGDVSSRIVRNIQKFYFIFNQSARPIPKKKIRILINSDYGTVNENGLDLAIFTSIYTAINNLNDRKKYLCIGNISLEGKIHSFTNIYNNLLNILKNTNQPENEYCIFLPTIDISEKYINQTKFCFLNEVRDIYNYFEGKDFKDSTLKTEKIIHKIIPKKNKRSKV